MSQYTVRDIPDASAALDGACLAAEYHDGQFTALYALASTGSLELHPGEGLGRIQREVADAVRTAESLADKYGDELYEQDAEALRAFAAWLVEAGRVNA